MDPLSTIASTIAVIEAISAVYKQIKIIKGIPEAFNAVGESLPLVQNSLTKAQAHLEATSDDALKGDIQAIVSRCFKNAKTVDRIFHRIADDEDEDDADSTNRASWDKIKKKYVTLVHKLADGHRVEKLMKKIVEDVNLLGQNRLYDTATSQELQGLIKRLNDVEPSMLDTDSGAGPTQNVHESATGYQYNGVGGTYHHVHGTQNIYNGTVYLGQQQGDSPIDADKELEAKRNELLESLHTTPYKERKDRNPKRVAGTLEWFLQHPLFREWKEGDTSSILWVSADPGAGKSVLAKHLVDHELEQNDTTTTCYYFFKDDFLDQKHALGAMNCVIHQLLTHQRQLCTRDVIDRARVGGGEMKRSFRDMWDILLTVLSESIKTFANDKDEGSRPLTIYCVLDALDECLIDGRDQLQKALSEFYDGPWAQQIAYTFKVLVTSRPYQEIKHGFHDFSGSEVPLIHLCGESEAEVAKIQAEIGIYVEAKIADLADRHKFTLVETVKFKKKVLQIPHRTYLWVYLTLDLIEKQFNEDMDLEAIASSLPKDVDDAYEKILGRIDGSKKEQAAKMLHIVVAAMRPLTVDEMIFCLFIKKGDKCPGDVVGIPMERRQGWIRGLCGLFVTIIDDTVYLLHQTAREFLVDYDERRRSQQRLSHISQDETVHIGRQYGAEWKDAPARRLGTALDDMVYAFRYMAKPKRNTKNQPPSPAGPAGASGTSASPNPLVIRPRDAHPSAYTKWKSSLLPEISHRLMADITMCHLHFESFSLLTTIEGSLDADGEMGSDDWDSLALAPTFLWYSLGNWSHHFQMAGGRGDDQAVWSLLDRAVYTAPPLAKSWFEMYFESGNPGQHLKRKNDLAPQGVISPLFIASYYGLDEVTKVILDRSGIAASMVDPYYGRTPLAWAAARGGYGTVRHILNYPMRYRLFYGRLNIDAQDVDGYTPLMLACEHGFAEVAAQLLEAGAAVDLTNERGETALNLAARQGHFAPVRYLLSTKADPNIATPDGETAICLAAMNGHEDIVEELIAAGADVNKTDQYGHTPFTMAASYGNNNILAMLKSAGVNVDAPAARGKTALHEAACGACIDTIQELLKWGADMYITDDDGNTTLMLAARHADLATVEFLLPWYDDLDTRNKNGDTALTLAIEGNKPHIVRFLLENGADPKAAALEGERALLRAALFGDEASVARILDLGLDPNVAERGVTPLMNACKSTGLGEIQPGKVALLLKAGADPNATNIWGQTAMNLASRGTDDSEAFATVVQQLLDAGADPTLKDALGNTPLHSAALFGRLRIVRCLLDGGVNIDDPNSKGITGLMEATKEGHTDIVECLLQAGADVNKTDNYGSTALMIAEMEGYGDIMGLLMRYGAQATDIEVESEPAT